jgi:hypothetical protein
MKMKKMMRNRSQRKNQKMKILKYLKFLNLQKFKITSISLICLAQILITNFMLSLMISSLPKKINTSNILNLNQIMKDLIRYTIT